LLDGNEWIAGSLITLNKLFLSITGKESGMKKVTCVVLGMLLLVAGCGKKIEEKIAEKITEKAIEHGTDGKAKVDLSKNTMTIETENGSYSAGTSSKIPDGFPSDIFIFKPSEMIGSMAGTGKGYSIAMKTSKDVASVTEAYKKTMIGNGWKQKAAMDMGAQAMLVYEKEKRTANIVIGQKDNETSIVIAASAEKSKSK
jgi:hypothetical protein